MNLRKSYLFGLFFLVFFLASLFIYRSWIEQTVEWLHDDDPLQEPVSIDLDSIIKRGTLRAITHYSSTNYFIYKGRPMGYEYELLERLAKELKVDLEVVVADSHDKIWEMLNRGEGDIIAMGLTIHEDAQRKVRFTHPHSITQQVIVQRKPEGWENMKLSEINQHLILDPMSLGNKKVHVRKGSPYYIRLMNLQQEMGIRIQIEALPGHVETEHLIRQVAEGEIDFTIADQHIAYINQTYHQNLDVSVPISFSQQIAWAIRRNHPQLEKRVNDWIDQMKQETDYYVIYNKYFKARKAYAGRMNSAYYSLHGGRISIYDELIRRYANDLNWDWRLLAALIYEESQFQEDATSWAGARGLMQLMPETALQFGAEDPDDLEQHMKAGVKYLNYLNRFWSRIPNPQERVKFVLASYNVGEYHVLDAQRLAEKYCKDPFTWFGHVDEFLRLKSQPSIYQDEVVKNGYCRGEEPYQYVRKVIKRYDQYRGGIIIDATASR